MRRRRLLRSEHRLVAAEREEAPIWDAKRSARPLLLVFGGQDALIQPRDIGKITETLAADHKKYDVQIYPNVGHSFFRTTGGGSVREAADAWDRVQSFLRRNLGNTA